MAATEVGPRVQRILDERKLKAVDLCRALNVSASRASNFLNGKNGWPVTLIEATAKFLDVSIDSLVTSPVHLPQDPARTTAQDRRRADGMNGRRRRLVDYIADMTEDELRVMEGALGRVLTRRDAPSGPDTNGDHEP